MVPWRSGRRLWAFPVVLGVHAAPAVKGHQVLISTYLTEGERVGNVMAFRPVAKNPGVVYALDKMTGKPAWEFRHGVPLHDGVAVRPMRFSHPP